VGAAVGTFADAGVPSAPVGGDVLDDGAVFADGEVRADATTRVLEPLDGPDKALVGGVVQDDGVDFGPARPGAREERRHGLDRERDEQARQRARRRGGGEDTDGRKTDPGKHLIHFTAGRRDLVANRMNQDGG
jgi:hypothetical protein